LHDVGFFGLKLRLGLVAEGQVFYNDLGEAFEEQAQDRRITRAQARHFFEDLLRRKTKDFFQASAEDRNRGLDATVGYDGVFLLAADVGTVKL
jgi:hypothetical protein